MSPKGGEAKKDVDEERHKEKIENVKKNVLAWKNRDMGEVEKALCFLFTCWYYIKHTGLSLHSHFVAAQTEERPVILR